MSSTLTRPFPPVLVRAGEAERLDLIGHVLLADSSATAGALSSHRVALGRGADGAVPHRHDNSSELFYILDGAFDLLVEDKVVTARTGDLLVVPPGSAPARRLDRARSRTEWAHPVDLAGSPVRVGAFLPRRPAEPVRGVYRAGLTLGPGLLLSG